MVSDTHRSTQRDDRASPVLTAVQLKIHARVHPASHGPGRRQARRCCRDWFDTPRGHAARQRTSRPATATRFNTSSNLGEALKDGSDSEDEVIRVSGTHNDGPRPGARHVIDFDGVGPRPETIRSPP